MSWFNTLYTTYNFEIHSLEDIVRAVVDTAVQFHSVAAATWTTSLGAYFHLNFGEVRCIP